MTPDSSVIIAALSPWHGAYADASRAIVGVEDLVAHAELEAYSVLTRLPPPSDFPAEIVAESLRATFPGKRLVLAAADRVAFVRRLAEVGVAKGAVYDGLIAETAARHELVLLTLDRRASRTYERLGVRYELIG